MFRGIQRKAVLAVWLVLFVLIAAIPCVAQSRRAIKLAPVNPAFSIYMDYVNNGKQQLFKTERKSYGLIPSPLDLSHTKGQSIFPRYSAQSLPASYDLRTLNKLTPVKDQSTNGSCWAFGALGSLESCLLPGESCDFSENNMKNTHGFDYADGDGGNRDMSVAYLTRWSGPVNEIDDPYNPNSGYSPSGLPVQKHVQQVLYIPDRTGPTDNNNIKQAIMDYGAVATSLYMDESYFKESTNAYYYNGDEWSNHLICIVGWDDNYDKSKFSTRPSGNGAFIMKNSWGSSWGDNGYFYVSYYDTIVGTENAVYMSAEPTTNQKNIYQHDPLGCTVSIGLENTTACWGANVFTAVANEGLSSVGFYALDPNTAYSIYVYLDTVDSPVKSTAPVATASGIANLGYHTVPLSSPVPLKVGQKFSVVLKVSTPGYDYPLALEYPFYGYSNKATASAGESYLSSDGVVWDDLTTMVTNTNVCIKAYTSSIAPVITISTPNTNPYQTNSNTVDLAGSVIGSCDIASMTWLNQTTGKSGICSGTSAWSADDIGLNIGTNVIIVTATDVVGNSASASITVNSTDITPPTINITSPSSNPSMTSDSYIDIAGTAIDDFGVSTVTWSNETNGESGVCIGTNSWSASNVPLSAGQNLITIKATDFYENSSDLSAVVICGNDVSSPTVNITSPTSNGDYTTTSQSLTISGTASDDVYLARVSWSNSRGGGGVCTGTTNWSANGIPLLLGTNTITIIAEDAYGHTGIDFITVNYIDGIPPSVKFTSPTSASTYSTVDSKLYIGGTASDNLAVASISWANDRGGSGTCSGKSVWSVSGVTLKTGLNNIRVTAYDADGNEGTATLAVTYTDGVPPTIKITFPTSTSSYSTSNRTVTLNGTASDSIGVQSVTWTNSLGGNGTCTGTDSWSANNIPLKAGLNILTVTAFDVDGNKASATLAVTCSDVIPPTVSITSPSTNSTNSQILSMSGTASDDVGVASVSWSNDKGGSGVCGGTNSWRADGIVLQPGTNIITVTASDAAGNKATATYTVTYSDTVKPTVQISGPTANAQYTTNDPVCCISGTASDDVNLASVAWSNSRGGAGVCSGTTSWSQSGITLLPGENVITVTASDNLKNTATATLTVTYYDTSDVTWSGYAMVSLPIIPKGIDPKPTVGFKDNAWIVYRPNSKNYAIYPAYDTLLNPVEKTPGRGFWAKFDSTVTVPVGELPAQDQPAVIHLQPGWNIIGQPFVTPVTWDSEKITVQEEGAEPRPLIQSDSAVANFVWGWTQDATNLNTGSYYLVSDANIMPTSVGELQPWQAFWIVAYKSCDLIIPAPEN